MLYQRKNKGMSIVFFIVHLFTMLVDTIYRAVLCSGPVTNHSLFYTGKIKLAINDGQFYKTTTILGS